MSLEYGGDGSSIWLAVENELGNLGSLGFGRSRPSSASGSGVVESARRCKCDELTEHLLGFCPPHFAEHPGPAALMKRLVDEPPTNTLLGLRMCDDERRRQSFAFQFAV